MDGLFERRNLRVRKCFDARKLPEQRGRDHVHARVGALGGQDHGDKELPGFLVREVNDVVGPVRSVETLEHRTDVFL